MHRHAITWASVLGVLALAAFVLILGVTLMPARDIAAERGITPQWILTWILIAITALTALVLAGFLVAVTAGKTMTDGR
jgi:predicted transcriptional regulator